MLTPSKHEIHAALKRLKGNLSTKKWQAAFSSNSAKYILQWLDKIGVSYMPGGKTGPGRGRKLKATSLEAALEIIKSAQSKPDYPPPSPRKERSDKNKPRIGNNSTVIYRVAYCPVDKTGVRLFREGATFTIHDLRYTDFPLGTILKRFELEDGMFIFKGAVIQRYKKKEIYETNGVFTRA